MLSRRKAPLYHKKRRNPQAQLQPCYGPPGDGEYHAQANAMGNWNPNGIWNPGKQKDAPWRDNPCFRWTEGNQQPPPPNLNPSENQQNWPHRTQEGQNHNSNWPSRNQEGPNFQQNWPNRNQEGQNDWGNRNQGNWVNRNQNPPSNNYVPPHQRNLGNQGPHANQGNCNQGQGPQSSQPYSRQPRTTDDMIGDLLASQQHFQNNVQANNDLVHKLQDAQQEQKVAMDMLAKQMSQIATSLNEMRWNEGRIPASVKPPERVNISQITLRSGREYKGPTMEVGEEIPVGIDQTGRKTGTMKDDIQEGDLGRPLPRDPEPFFLDPGNEENNKGAIKATSKTSPEELSKTT